MPRPSKGGRGGSWRCELWEALEWRLLTSCSSLESFKVEVVERELPSRSLKAGIDLRERGLQLGKGICPHYETLKHDDEYYMPTIAGSVPSTWKEYGSLLGSVAKVSEVCLLLLWPCLALLVLAPSVAPRPALPDEESLRPRKSVFTASSELSTRAKSDTAPTWAGSQHSNKASWEMKTLPKAQRTRGLSSSCQSNLLRSYHKFKHKSHPILSSESTESDHY